ncbi:vitellogenin-2-like [Sceloporus undulatus]|uniref:vitellogenin-2-like n=1 Tax=Sceloporus undulatus TaxID=8520 RepID=UPI001C4C550D|nr:vitellogenin-2-like [Sceloporus undulatus]
MNEPYPALPKFVSSFERLHCKLQVSGMVTETKCPIGSILGVNQKIKDTERKLPGFKDIPLERPLLAANLKILGQEVMFFTPEETMQLKKLGEERLLGPQALGMVYQIIQNIDQQITQALILEVRHIVPTSLGIPFEVSAAGIAMVHSSLKAKAAGNDEGQKMVREQLQLESHVVFQGYGKLIWGINTDFCQHIVEITSQFRIQSSLKMDATWDVKARNFKVEIEPIHEEYELAEARHEAHVVRRHLNSEKKSPVLPERPVEDILTEEFKPRKDDVKQSRSSYKPSPRDTCITFHIYPVKVCLETMKKRKDVMPLRNTWMHFLCETHEVRLLMTPVVAMEKIKWEIQQVLELPRLKRQAKHHGGRDECQNFPIPPKGQDAICTTEYAPVCGSDGETYPNKCSFCIAKRASGNTITIEHDGQCEQEEDECRNYPAPPKGKDNPCTREYDPVCGSDHETYPNLCTFCNVKRKSGNEITVEHEGECEQEGGKKSQKKPSWQSKKQDPDSFGNPDSSSSSSGSPSFSPSSSSSSEPATKKRQERRRGDSSDSSDNSSNSDSSDSSDTSSSESKGPRHRGNKRLYQQKTKDRSSSSSDTMSNDSSDTRSSSESDEILEKGQRREIYQYTFRPVKLMTIKRRRSFIHGPRNSDSGAPLPHSSLSSEEDIDYSVSIGTCSFQQL